MFVCVCVCVCVCVRMGEGCSIWVLYARKKGVLLPIRPDFSIKIDICTLFIDTKQSTLYSFTRLDLFTVLQPLRTLAAFSVS
jgi:hypothetical protein